jgi:hypothetical protein
MQSKPQSKPTPISTPVVQANKVEPSKQPQPLEMKALGQVAGGARLPFTGW